MCCREEHPQAHSVPSPSGASGGSHVCAHCGRNGCPFLGPPPLPPPSLSHSPPPPPSSSSYQSSPALSSLLTCLLFLLLCHLVAVCGAGTLKKGSSTAGYDRPYSKCHFYFNYFSLSFTRCLCFVVCAVLLCCTCVACRATANPLKTLLSESVVSVVRSAIASAVMSRGLRLSQSDHQTNTFSELQTSNGKNLICHWSALLVEQCH